MSCDYAVWFTPNRLTSSEAVKLYHRLLQGDVSGATFHPGISALYSDLTSMHPEVDAVAEQELEACPWSATFDRSDGHIVVCAAWAKADYIGELMKRLAFQHDLAFFDPQSERVMYRDGDDVTTRPWWKFWSTSSPQPVSSGSALTKGS